MKKRNAWSRMISILVMSFILFCHTMRTDAAITVFSQLDSRWSSYSYGKDDQGQPATIGSAGCGILSYVNAIYYLNGSFIQPKTLAQYSLDNHHRINGAGTSETLYKPFADAHGSEYGFEYAGRVNKVTDAKSYLQSGCTGVLHVQGHWVAVVDYNSSNSKYLILDSYKSSNRGTSGTGYRWMTASEFTGKMAQVGTYSVYLFRNKSGPDEVDTRYPTPFSAYPLATSGLITVYNGSLTAYSQSEHNIAYRKHGGLREAVIFCIGRSDAV